MKISESKHYAPALELRAAKPAAGAQDPPAPVLADKTDGTGESDRETKGAPEPMAAPPLMDFQLAGVRNDFSSKYHRAALALEGSIYRLAQSQSALLNSSEEPGELIALPENSNLQQTADGLAMLAHLESVKFKEGD